MSELYETVDDDVFANFVKEQKAAAEAQAAKQGFGGGFTGDFEQIKYCAAPKGGHAIVRFVGNPPREDGTNIRPTDCIERHISKIKDDNGKLMYLVLPCRADTLEQDHIMWRIISQVKEKQWINKTSVYVNQSKHPDVWEIVTKGGYTPEDGKQYTYAEGWDAKRKFLINCIDRSDNWCKENKHTKVFSKNISISDSGVEFAEQGVKSYGFLTKLTENMGKYGSWESYDSYIMRIGEKTEPFRILNGSAYKAGGMLAELQGATPAELEMISTDKSLTDEERSYERYDLEKHFKVSSYQKILKRLGNSIKKIDAAFQSHYYDELVTLAQKEKEAYQIDKEAQEQQKAQNSVVASISAVQPTATSQILVNTDGDIKVSPVAPSSGIYNEVKATPSFDTMNKVTPVEEPVTRREAPVAPTADYPFLKGYDKLSDSEKAMIVNASQDADGTIHIEYTADAPHQLPCPRCNVSSPSNMTHCPGCGAKFG